MGTDGVLVSSSVGTGPSAAFTNSTSMGSFSESKTLFSPFDINHSIQRLSFSLVRVRDRVKVVGGYVSI